MGARSRAAEAAIRLLVEPAAKLHGVQRVGPAAAVRRRHRRRRPAGKSLWSPDSLLGVEFASPPADHRPGRQPPDGAGVAAGPRPDTRIRLSRRGRRHDEPRRFDLDLVPKGRQVPRREDGRDSARTGRCGAAAGAAQGLWRRAAADQRHRPVARRPVSLCRLLGHRRAAAIRRHRSDEAPAGGQRAHRRHCPAHRTSERLGLRRRSSDDRDQS